MPSVAVRAVEGGLRLLTFAGAYAGMVAILGIMGLTVANVIARKFFNSSVPSAVEGSEEALVIAVFLGFAAAQRSGSHVATHLLTGRFPFRVRAAIRAGANLAVLAFVVWALKGSLAEAQYSIKVHEEIASVINFATWPARIAIVVGFALLCAEVVRSIVILLARPDAAQEPTVPGLVADRID